ncbi:hypothetical protein ENHAE0001_0667 [Enhydrobacter aerosaccus SK60]|nr:hypothetical protein ENHAE0001_0667 [Enhydrobacter aerosaccus SK60]
MSRSPSHRWFRKLGNINLGNKKGSPSHRWFRNMSLIDIVHAPY